MMGMGVVEILVLVVMVVAIAIVIFFGVSANASKGSGAGRDPRRLEGRSGELPPFGAAPLTLLEGGGEEEAGEGWREDDLSAAPSSSARVLRGLVRGLELPQLDELPFGGAPIEVEVAVWGDDEEDEAPVSFSGDALMRLLLDGEHPLYVATGYLSLSDEGVEDPSGYGEDGPLVYRKAYGGVGCVSREAGRAWTDAFAAATGLELPPPRRGKRRDELTSAAVMLHGRSRRDGASWFVLSLGLGFTGARRLYIELREDGEAARIWPGEVKIAHPEVLADLTARLRDGEFERPTTRNDEQMLQDAPLVRELLPVPGGLEEEFVFQAAAGKVHLITCDFEQGGAPADVVLHTWERLDAEPTSRVITREEALGYELSRDAEKILLHLEPGVVQVWSAAGVKLHEFELPGDTDTECSVIFSPDGSQVATIAARGAARFIRVLDLDGRVASESGELEGELGLVDWSGAEVLVELVEDIEDRELDHALERVFGWDPETYAPRPLTEEGWPGPGGRYHLRHEPHGFSIWERGVEVASRPARSLRDFSRLARGLQYPWSWLEEHLVVVDAKSWEVFDVRTGLAAPVLSASDEERFYTLDPIGDGVILFRGSGEVRWARVELPAEMEAGAATTSAW